MNRQPNLAGLESNLPVPVMMLMDAAHYEPLVASLPGPGEDRVRFNDLKVASRFAGYRGDGGKGLFFGRIRDLVQ